MVDRTENKPPSAWRLHLLAWLDAIEKLDILILELRHLQKTCIYGLRLPDLTALLLWEELLLDPDAQKKERWDAVTKDERFLEPDGDTLALARKIAKKYVRLFPKPWDEAADTGSPSESREDGQIGWDGQIERIAKDIRAMVKERWRGNRWSDARKDLYEVLAAAQRVKRQIMADRVFLFLEGRKALFPVGGPSKANIAESGSHLFILRIGVLSRAHVYLDRVGDLQQRLAQHLEAMPPEYPRPNVQRRRSQGLYTHYLIDRVTYLRESMNVFLAHLQGQRQPKPFPRIFHHWLHAYSSSQGTLRDEVEAVREPDGKPAEDREWLDFVRTGYWMPDKPDNQPILAHELAHHALRQHYDNLLPQTLGAAPPADRFAALMREISRVLEKFQVNPVDADVQAIDAKEIACDLLAGGIKGISYLYAFFFEVVGWGLEHTLVDQHGYRPHLSVSLELRHQPDGAYARDLRDWYVRGRILVAWLRATAAGNDNRSTADGWVLDGVEQVLNDLNKYLDSTILNRVYQSGNYWRKVADVLCRLVETSGAAARTRSWRASRGGAAETREISRFALPLPETFREALRGYMAKGQGGQDRKCNPNRLPKHDEDLFEHVFDIPWQCALIRAGDLFVQGEGIRVGVTGTPVKRDGAKLPAADLYRLISKDTSFGRRFFFLAVEINFAMVQLPCERLRTLRRLLKENEIKNTEATAEKTKDSVDEWLDEAEVLLDKELEQRRLNESPGKIRGTQRKQGNHVHSFYKDCTNPEKKLRQCLETRAHLKGQIDELILPYLSIHASDKSQESKNDTHALHRQIRLPSRSLFERTLGRWGQDTCSYANQLWDIFCVNNVSQDGNNGVELPPEPFEFLLAVRVTVAARQENESIDFRDLARPAVGRDRPQWIDLLGDFSALTLRGEYRPICRCPAPLYADGLGGVCQPIFASRETWVRTAVTRPPPGEGDYRIELAPLTDVKAGDRFSRITGFLFIQLNRRFTRLDFLYWVWHWGRLPGQFGLTDDDDVFLTDGWADIVFVLSDRTTYGTSDQGPAKKPRGGGALFDLQCRVNDNFMVSRTELLSTKHCLANAGVPDARLSLYALVRIEEGRLASPTHQEVVSEIRKVLINTQDWPRGKDCKIFRLTGRIDLTVTLARPTVDDFDKLKVALQHRSLHGVIDSYDLFLTQAEEPGQSTTGSG